VVQPSGDFQSRLELIGFSRSLFSPIIVFGHESFGRLWAARLSIFALGAPPSRRPMRRERLKKANIVYFVPKTRIQRAASETLNAAYFLIKKRLEGCAEPTSECSPAGSAGVSPAAASGTQGRRPLQAVTRRSSHRLDLTYILVWQKSLPPRRRRSRAKSMQH